MTFRRGRDINTESGIVPRVGIRDNLQGIQVTSSFRGRDQKMNLLWEEWMSDKRTDVATHNGSLDNKKSPHEPSRSLQSKSSCDNVQVEHQKLCRDRNSRSGLGRQRPRKQLMSRQRTDVAT